MIDRRGSSSPRRAPGRFRCLPCRRYVTGTESGHCPSCGFVPPSAPELPAAAPGWSVGWLLVVAAAIVALVGFVTH